jgi:sec-independent protein translocase protein TatC
MTDEKKLTLLEHLGELRKRMVRCAFAVLALIILCFIFADQIFKVLLRPAGGSELIFIEITEMIGIYMKVCLTAAIILAMPYIIFQLVMFVAPALTAKEKRYVNFVLPWVGLMFIGGVVFGYFVLLPPALNFLFNFGNGVARAEIRIENYVSVVSRLLLAIGLIFELPVLTTFLARIGIVNYKWLAGKRKIAIILSVVLAAIITPTVDPINMMLVAIPLVVLYEISIWLAKFLGKKKPQASAAIM